jgi:hypothetical protein
MLMIEFASRHIIPAAYALLPDVMNSPRATAMLLAIALQESKFHYRRQQPNGPAHGFWQFEQGGGVKGVLEHHESKPHIVWVLSTLRYPANPAICHRAIQDNDILGCVFARLLLWTDPDGLPDKGDVNTAWEMYLRCWRPGKPKPDTWDDNYAEAWAGLP